MKKLYQPPEDRYIFGQFLIETRKIKKEVLDRAYADQYLEDSPSLKTSSRFLGQILLEKYGVFKDRIELNHYLIEYSKYKTYVEDQLFNLHNLADSHNL